MERIKNFIHSIWFYVPVVLIAVLFNCLDLGIVGFCLLVGIICAILIIDDDFAPVLCVIGACVYALNEYPITSTYYIVFGSCVAVFLPCLAFFVYKNIKSGVQFRLGKFFIPLVLLVVAFSFGGIFSPYYNIGSFGFGLVISGSALISYLLMYNFTKTKFVDLAFNLLTVVSSVIIIEMWWSILASGDVLNALQTKKAVVGVGEINLPALTVGMWIPLILAKGINSRYDYLYLLLGVFALLNVVASCSRGALLFTLIFGLVSVVVFFIKTKQKKNVGITLGALLGIVVLGVVAFLPLVSELLQHYISRGFDDTGRFDIYKLGWGYFTAYPVFGVGFQADVCGFPFSQFHSTLVQYIASTGIVGTLLILPHIYQRYASFIIKGNLYTFFAGMSVLIMAGYGMIDQTSTFAMSYVYALVLMLASEESKQNKSTLCEDINRTNEPIIQTQE